MLMNKSKNSFKSLYILAFLSAVNIFYSKPSFALPIQDAYKMLEEGKLDEGIALLRKLAATNTPQAAQLLEYAISAKKNLPPPVFSYEKDLRHLSKGHKNAIDGLGIITRFKGDFSGISGQMEMQSLIQAAQTNPNAQYKLALLFQEGIGVPYNLKNAHYYFKKASQNNNPNALNSYGVYARFGLGTNKPDKDAAEISLKKAVLLNNPYAFFNLSSLYLDKKKWMEAYLLATFGKSRLSNNTEHKKYDGKYNIYARAAKKRLTPLEQAYLKKYVPYWMSSVLNKDDLEGRIFPKALPLPPKEMIKKTTWFEAINAGAFDGKYKDIPPLMPNWVPFELDQKDINDLTNKNPLAPSPETEEVINTLYYRRATPSKFKLTLNKKNNSIPVMEGDVFEIYVYSKLTENELTKKGGHFYKDNTDYKIYLDNASGALMSDNKPVLTALSIETRNEETWFSQTFKAIKKGKSVIRFIPQNATEDHPLVPITLTVDVN
ncbi:MAG: sel1 repeat family protein [Alphaproteobacteria bacterium]|nr:sel1 repeat family protein [Alphaproteobacteria bacterium]